MYCYEIKNTRTQETAQTIAKGFAEACKEQGWKPNHCRCIWKAGSENAGESAHY